MFEPQNTQNAIKVNEGFEVLLDRQMSEPAKIQTTMKFVDLPGFFFPKPPGLAPLQCGLFRQMLEPLKEHEDTASTSPSTESGGESISPRTVNKASGFLGTSPVFGPAADSLLPCWVKHRSLPRCPASVGAGSGLVVTVRGFPEDYIEEAFLEELRDGGFIKNRDFNHLDFHYDGSSRSTTRST